MSTKLTRKEQKDKWSVLNRTAFTEDLLTAQPKDFQERNHFYKVTSSLLSYPLQFISILAGSYLLYDIFRFVWQLTLDSWQGISIFISCILVFVGIESLRRWLVNTTGYNYLTTFKLADQRLKKGEWLKSNLLVLGIISLILVATGTLGMYEYIKNNSPKAATIDIQTITSPLEEKIMNEKKGIQQLDQKIQGLMQAKKTELEDARSYATWKGKEYLLPEVKQRHENYDRQILAMQNQSQQHQNLVVQYENKLNKKESKTENQNAAIEEQNTLDKEMYAGITAGIWLIFEMLLIFMLSYTWIYLYQSKKERLLEQLAHSGSLDDTAPDLSEETPANHYQNNLTHLNGHKVNGLNGADYPQNQLTQSEIGFMKWYEEEDYEKEDSSKEKKEAEPRVIIKEVEVPVIKEVYVEKEPGKPASTQNKEGFQVTCAHCGKEVVKKRPAKYCSDTCRNKAWKEKKGQKVA